MQIIKKPVAPKTLKEAGMRALVNTAKIIGGLLVGALLVHWLTGGQQEIIEGGMQDIPQQHQQIVQKPVKDSPAYVLGKHQDSCWTSEQDPKAELPGAAVVQFNEALAAIGYGDITSDKIDVIALCI